MTSKTFVKTKLALAILLFIKHGESLPWVLFLQLLQEVLVVQLDPLRSEEKRNIFFSLNDVM